MARTKRQQEIADYIEEIGSRRVDLHVKVQPQTRDLLYALADNDKKSMGAVIDILISSAAAAKGVTPAGSRTVHRASNVEEQLAVIDEMAKRMSVIIGNVLSKASELKQER